jgi:phage terminase large subunit-like protein
LRFISISISSPVESSVGIAEAIGSELDVGDGGNTARGQKTPRTFILPSGIPSDRAPLQTLDLEKLTEAELEQVLDDFNVDELLRLKWGIEWKSTARSKQLPPAEFLSGKKPYWGLRSGRGFGKTLTAAQHVGQWAVDNPGSIIHVIAPTYDDTRYVCFEGPTGLYSVIPPEFIADSNKSLPSITLTNGTIIRGFAADTPNRLRGPQCHAAWCEEIASWRYPKETWSNIEFGLRLGDSPWLIWTSTPRPTPFMRERDKDPRAVVVTGSTYENAENLTPIFYENVAKYEGTTIGRQELHGEILDPEEAGFIKRSKWRLWPAAKPLPKFLFIIYSFDTAFTEETYDKKTQERDPTAASVWGLFDHDKKKHVMLLDCWEDRLGFPDLVDRVKKERDWSYGDSEEPILKPKLPDIRQRPRHQGRRPDLLLVEDKGSGISLRQQLARENLLTESYNPGQLDKLSRLHLVSPMFAHGRVWTIESKKLAGHPKPKFDPLITQVCTYVGEGSLEHDDLMDTTTQALRVFMDKFPIGPFTVKIDPLEVAKQKAMAARISQKSRRNPYAE